MRKLQSGRNLIGISCLLGFVVATTAGYAQDAAPTIASVMFHASPASGGTYERGERVQVEVRFDRAVRATGKPRVALTVGSHTRYATYSGWGGQSLYFDYTVQERDRDADGISVAANALSLDGGTIRVADGTTDADLTHGAVAAKSGQKVNGSWASPPAVTSIGFFSPARGDTYQRGETIELLVEFHRAVTVSGSPRLALNIGTQTRQAAYSMTWPDGRFLQFGYTVQAGDRDENGIGVPANGLTLGAGTITAADGAGDADLTHAAEPPWRGTKVDGSRITIPSVEGISIVSFPARGDTYELGETLEVEARFDGGVETTGSPPHGADGRNADAVCHPLRLGQLCAVFQLHRAGG